MAFCYHWHWMNCKIYFAIICLNFSPLMKTSKLTSHLKGHLSPFKLIPMTFFTFLSLEEIIVKTKDELHWGIEWGFFEKKNQYFLGFVWFIVSMQCTIYGIKICMYYTDKIHVLKMKNLINRCTMHKSSKSFPQFPKKPKTSVD